MRPIIPVYWKSINPHYEKLEYVCLGNNIDITTLKLKTLLDRGTTTAILMFTEEISYSVDIEDLTVLVKGKHFIKIVSHKRGVVIGMAANLTGVFDFVDIRAVFNINSKCDFRELFVMNSKIAAEYANIIEEQAEIPMTIMIDDSTTTIPVGEGRNLMVMKLSDTKDKSLSGRVIKISELDCVGVHITPVGHKHYYFN
jgi:hypothetical protein